MEQKEIISYISAFQEIRRILKLEIYNISIIRKIILLINFKRKMRSGPKYISLKIFFFSFLSPTKKIC